MSTDKALQNLSVALQPYNPKSLSPSSHGILLSMCLPPHLLLLCMTISLSLLLFLFFFKIDFYSFMFNYFCLHCVIALHGLSLVAVNRGYSLFAVYGLLFSMVLLLQSTGSRDHGLSSCGTWA